MKKIYKLKTVLLFVSMLLLASMSIPGTGWSAETEADQVSLGPVNASVLFIRAGQSKTYTVESDFFPDIMTIFLFVDQSGTASITLTKTDTPGELIGLMQVGGYQSVENSFSQKYDATVGYTPCTLTVRARFWNYGFGVIMSGLITSIEPGPHKYTLSISYRKVGTPT